MSPISLDEVRMFNDTFFNPVTLEVFLCGLYSALLVQALWGLHRKGGKKLYSFTLCIVWACVIADFMLHWQRNYEAFVTNNSTPLAIFLELNAGTASPFVGIPGTLLIWRCNIIWYGNKWIMLVLIPPFIATVVTNAWTPFETDGSFGVLLSGLSTLTSVLTTLAATCLISWRIALVTRRSNMLHSYTKIIEILIESAALITIVNVVQAILQLISVTHPISLTNTSGVVIFELYQYLSFIQGPVIGIAPTLIALRVAEEQPRTKVVSSNQQTNILSRLTFRRTETRNNGDATWADPSSGRPGPDNEQA
ncbi:hypothetical protein D9619_012050 [Psilocybe cf. subviscida]|uniref:Uncharacterized protein n=1 Tax=Psilocybe cf. subviscida TaxID=2480587 RepID=A0A8H5EZG5_9AGAR|nr:hypothetical protein D9619_012050 [Psilocybe cf. subviscida]